MKDNRKICNRKQKDNLPFNILLHGEKRISHTKKYEQEKRNKIPPLRAGDKVECHRSPDQQHGKLNKPKAAQ